MRLSQCFCEDVVLVVGAALLVRTLVGVHGYSGQGQSPRFGDYEAQRHWMEITLNTPLLEWYEDTPSNSLEYWGLDYPPLSAYQSYLTGVLLRAIEPEAVALQSSRGYETESSKRAMRLTVVAADVLVCIPSCLWAAIEVSQLFTRSCCSSRTTAGATAQRQLDRTARLLAGALLLQPALLLIDHGHFQYNGIALGLTMAAVAALLRRWDYLGSALYVLAIHHKHMLLYCAPAFFSYLLGTCMTPLRRDRVPLLPALRAACARLAGLALAVTATALFIWAPFLVSPASALQVLKRLVPVHRGLFEDYVANFWCATHTLIKWKRLLPQHALVRLCSAATLAALAPACVHQVLRPSRLGFLYCLVNCSMAFFLFAYQVHEKGILIPLLCATLLLPWERRAVLLISPVALFSLFPLLQRDGQTLPYVALTTASVFTLPLLVESELPTTSGASHENVKGEREEQDDGAVAASSGVRDSAPEAARRHVSQEVLALQRVRRRSVQDGQLQQPSARRDVPREGRRHGAGEDHIGHALWGRHQRKRPLLCGHTAGALGLSALGMVVLHAARSRWAPPDHLPYLHDALFTTYAALHFGAFFVYMTYRQLVHV